MGKMPTRYRRLLEAPLGVSLLMAGCRGEPAPTVASAVSSARPASQAQAPSGAATVRAVAPAPAPPVSAPSASAPVPAPSSAAGDSGEEPALVGPDGAPLPQTDARPSITSARFERRMQRLADSILTGDAERARETFFPLVAYAQVKAVQKPERDYRYRLWAHFERDVREYHRQLGKEAERATFVGVEVPDQQAQWMKPGREGNRLGYFRVLRSRLKFRLVGGAEKTFELTSMISWRGEWYVVHLHGFE